MKYVIQIRSKYTGETFWLGLKHNTREEAMTYAENDVCQRCNQTEIYSVDDKAMWISKHAGFVVREPVEKGIKEVQAEEKLRLAKKAVKTAKDDVDRKRKAIEERRKAADRLRKLELQPKYLMKDFTPKRV